MQPTTYARPILASVQCPAWLPKLDPDSSSCPAESSAFERAEFAALPLPRSGNWLERGWHWLRGTSTESRVEASATLRERVRDGGVQLLAMGDSVHASVRTWVASREASPTPQLPAWARSLAEGKGEVLLADSHDYPGLLEQALGDPALAMGRAAVLPQREGVLVDAGRLPVKGGFVALGDLLHAAPDLPWTFKREAVDEVRRTLEQATDKLDADALIEAAADVVANDPPRLPLARDLHKLLGDRASGIALAALVAGEQPAIRHLVAARLVLHANECDRGLLGPVIGDFDLLQHGLKLEMEATAAARPSVFWAMDPASFLPARVAAHRYLRPRDRVESNQGVAPASEQCNLRVAFSREASPNENTFLVTVLRAYQGSFRNHAMDVMGRSQAAGSELLAAGAAVSYLVRKSGQTLKAGAASATADALQHVIAARAASDGVHYEEAERRVLSVLYDPRRSGTPQDVAELAQLQAQLQR